MPLAVHYNIAYYRASAMQSVRFKLSGKKKIDTGHEEQTTSAPSLCTVSIFALNFKRIVKQLVRQQAIVRCIRACAEHPP